MQSFYRAREETVMMGHDEYTDMDYPFMGHYLRMDKGDNNVETIEEVIRLHNLMRFTILFPACTRNKLTNAPHSKLRRIYKEDYYYLSNLRFFKLFPL